MEVVIPHLPAKYMYNELKKRPKEYEIEQLELQSTWVFMVTLAYNMNQSQIFEFKNIILHPKLGLHWILKQ